MTEAERIASRADRGRALFAIAIVAVCLIAVVGLGGAIVANVVNAQQDTKITKVERSACAQDPSSSECQRVKRLSDRRRSVADTCIAFWKVGYRCPAPSSGIPVPARGGDAIQPAQAGQPPAPAKTPAHHHGDAGHTHTQPGDDDPEAPAAEAPEVSPTSTGKPAGEEAAGSTTTTATPESAPETSTGLLDNPGGTVGEVVCSVNALGIRVCTE